MPSYKKILIFVFLLVFSTQNTALGKVINVSIFKGEKDKYNDMPYKCLKDAVDNFSEILTEAVTQYNVEVHKYPKGWDVIDDKNKEYETVIQSKIDNFINENINCIEKYNPKFIKEINALKGEKSITDKLKSILNFDSKLLESTLIESPRGTNAAILFIPCEINCNEPFISKQEQDKLKKNTEILNKFSELQNEYEQLKTFPPNDSYEVLANKNKISVNELKLSASRSIEAFKTRVTSLKEKIERIPTNELVEKNKSKVETFKNDINTLLSNVEREEQIINDNAEKIKEINIKKKITDDDKQALEEIKKRKTSLTEYKLFNEITEDQNQKVDKILNRPYDNPYKIYFIIFLMIVFFAAIFISFYFIRTKQISLQSLLHWPGNRKNKRPNEFKNRKNKKLETQTNKQQSSQGEPIIQQTQFIHPTQPNKEDETKTNLLDSLKNHTERIDNLEEYIHKYNIKLEEKADEAKVEKIERRLEFIGKEFTKYIDKKIGELQKKIDLIQNNSAAFQSEIQNINTNIQHLDAFIEEVRHSMDDEYHQLLTLNREFLDKLESERRENGKLFGKLSNYFMADNRGESGKTKELQSKEFIAKSFGEIWQFYQQAGAFSKLWKKQMNNEEMSPEEKRELKYRMMDLAYNKSLSLEFVNVKQWVVKNMRFFDDLATELMNDKLNYEHREEELDRLNAIMEEFFLRKYIKVFPGDVVNSNLHDILGTLNNPLLEEGVVAKAAFPGIYLIRGGKEILKDKCKIDVNRKYS